MSTKTKARKESKGAVTLTAASLGVQVESPVKKEVTKKPQVVMEVLKEVTHFSINEDAKMRTGYKVVCFNEKMNQKRFICQSEYKKDDESWSPGRIKKTMNQFDIMIIAKFQDAIIKALQ